MEASDEAAGGVFLRSQHSMGFLVNIAARIDPGAPPAPILVAASQIFGGRGFELLCLVGRDEDLEAAAMAAGLEPSNGPEPLEYLARSVLPAAGARDVVDVRAVRGADGAADVIAVNTDASSVYGFPADFFEVILGRPETIAGDDLTAFVGYVAGRPMATAQLFMHADAAYVGWVAVRRAAQRRGYGRLLTQAVVTEGFRRGAQAAVLMASPMGAPVYRKMGFVDVGGLLGLTSPPTE